MSFPCFFAIFVTVKSKQMAGNDCCIKRSAIILGAFMLFFVLWYFNIAVRPFEGYIGSSRTLHYTLNYLLAGLIPTGALFLLHARRDIASSMGLSHGFGTGLLFAVTATLPMIAGYAVIGEFDGELSADEAFTWIFIAGMFEELVYRGFVFGQLFRYARWGFLPAALLAALAFGSLHLYQGHDPASALTAFGVTALGSIFFSWLYVEWNYNLWSVIWLHTLMNLPWIVFRVSTSGAVGDIGANALRLCTIILAIGLTVAYKRKQGLPYRIQINTLITNKIQNA